MKSASRWWFACCVHIGNMIFHFLYYHSFGSSVVWSFVISIFQLFYNVYVYIYVSLRILRTIIKYKIIKLIGLVRENDNLKKVNLSRIIHSQIVFFLLLHLFVASEFTFVLSRRCPHTSVYMLFRLICVLALYSLVLVSMIRIDWVSIMLFTPKR